ncbi:alpha/beta fold hydrolase [Hydrogenophaga sp.]|uniref:alpha/beta fold hydrolase n=1 Tax=Hydrogenophaga sp. TaxID=1904254 RepID=UPI002731206D|nr:alpha/beta hydrolase [Hydrogenophaga sp.]MDP2075642.1 alpha/beta hydrolase [Hydrogenophaga sp.]MDP3107756.1 alpha/beta hydrolase [Hydrogenophaga sp.]MDP3347602.1 alpha/beta hydrolase [Hydrogenophaga sp.]MDZ4397892.1 alpha/beta hydrolase [Hydrogenophaga sp.]
MTRSTDSPEGLHVDRRGSGDVLVLVHGYLGGSSQWSAEMQALSPHLDVIAMDLPGFGKSRHLTSPDEVTGYAQAVLDCLDHMGVQRFHLLGHSMGGMIVQEVVRLAPQRVIRLILYATGPLGLLPGRFETMARSRERLAQDGVESTARRISATWLLHREASPMAEVLGDLAAQASAQAAEAGLWAMERWDGRNHLPKITQPTLIVWGDQDRSYQWPQIEALWRGIAGASLAVLPHCSHALHLEYPGAFHSLLLDFLLGPSNRPKSSSPAG